MSDPKTITATPGAPDVSLLVPTRDHPALLGQLVKSLAHTLGERRCELIVIDNGSRDAAAVAQLKALPDSEHADAIGSIAVLRAPGRFNYSALNNLGAAHSRAPFLCLLNDDIEATEPGWLDALLRRAELPRSGCIGAKLLYPDGRLQHAGVMLGMGPVAGHPFRGLPGGSVGHADFLRHDQTVSAVTGACLLVARATWTAVGGMDEALAVAYNDVDFCLRVRASGLENRWTPAAVLLHHESLSRGRGRRRGLIRGLRHRAEVRLMQRRWGALLKRDPCLAGRVPEFACRDASADAR